MYEFELHAHTSNHSGCSRMSVGELIRTAMEVGLAGVCLTDHRYQWPQEEMRAALEEAGEPELLLVPGIEVNAISPETGMAAGDVIVLGCSFEYTPPMSAEQIVRRAHLAGGIAIAAHPFRPQNPLGEALGRAGFDAIEVYNFMNDPQQTELSRQAAREFGLPTVAGSDAHATGAVGLHRMCFPEPIREAEDLITQLRARSYSIRLVNPLDGSSVEIAP